MPDRVPQLLNWREVASALRISPHTVRRWASGPNPRLRPIKLGRLTRFHPDEVSALIERSRRAGAPRKSQGND